MASASLYLLYLLFSFLLFCCGYRDACWRWRDWRKVMSSWILLTNETMPKVISNEMAVTVSIRELPHSHSRTKMLRVSKLKRGASLGDARRYAMAIPPTTSPAKNATTTAIL